VDLDVEGALAAGGDFEPGSDFGPDLEPDLALDLEPELELGLGAIREG
jgi:hypothetical protein